METLTRKRCRLGVAVLGGCVALAGCGGTPSGEPAATTATPGATATARAHDELASARRTNARLRREISRARRQLRARRRQAPEQESPSDAAAASGEASSGGVLDAQDARSFEALSARLGGQSGVAVSAVGRGQPVSTAGALQQAVAWSTSKVPVAMAVVASGRGAAQAQDLRAAITASDNAAAERLWSALGDGDVAAQAATEQLRAAGDASTAIESQRLRAGFTPFGQTAWPLAAQARFTAGMACTAAGRDVLELMGQTISSQRWGLGAVDGAARLKGGWGPGVDPGQASGYLDRQMGVITVHGRPLAAAIATLPADGSHESGTRNLTAIAEWLVAHVHAAGLPSRPRC